VLEGAGLLILPCFGALGGAKCQFTSDRFALYLQHFFQGM